MAIDSTLAKRAGHQPSGERPFRKQRTVNPPMVPAQSNFLTTLMAPVVLFCAEVQVRRERVGHPLTGWP
jgi:hypothetical protein